LDYSQNSPEVEKAKENINSDEKVVRIFRKQKPEGYWESDEQPYHPKYKSTYWHIMILGQLGPDKDDERVRRVCEYIFRFQLEEGGFSTFMEEGARARTDPPPEGCIQAWNRRENLANGSHCTL